MSEISRVLESIERGDPQAAGELLPLVYGELRRLARQKLSREAPGQTLSATALVHEAYLRLVGESGARRFAGREHFFAAAAGAMRNLLVDNARRKRREKHGGQAKRVELNDDVPAVASAADELLAIDEALKRLAAADTEAAAVVQLRYFGGMSVEEAAESLGISRATAYRHWTFARAWLLNEIDGRE
jgi:RNA polymerase sigma factor (TIGR02999 family)